ncbi:hypothetical protein CCR85_01325 [Rhodothalassium salexigens]|uniref:phage tail protein n=1 Tax=Rhodothalassium salexigens TaxID=1086 RepID=UPI0019132791|nr:phage tail protein [Rhodothalassium salexigens]MBK5910134.1 hypothetical protein [Rhodothalassium salexigens]MBK5920747.1 hypothetical protein [Rhodothalassium salexigens]
MKKLAAARRHLLASPLGIRADALLTFAEDGRVVQNRARGAPASFQLDYTAHLIVTDYTGAPADLMFVMLDWIDGHVPGAPADALSFHVDVIDHDRVDVSLRLDLVETVQARADATGTILTAQDDPDAQRMDAQALGLTP